jgi:hypothetical protein
MKTICCNCGTVLSDEWGRIEPAYFDSLLPAPWVRRNPSAVFARCEPCYAVARERSDQNYADISKGGA